MRWTRRLPEQYGTMQKPILAFFIFQLVLLSGCAFWAKPDEPIRSEATAAQLTQLLAEREAALRTVKGLFRVQVKGIGSMLAQRVEGAMYYRRPNAFRLQGFTQIGGPLFDVVVADDRYRLRVATSGKVYQGHLADLPEVGAIGKPIQLSLLAMSGAVGTESVGDGAQVSLAEEEDRYRLDVAQPNGAREEGTIRRRIWFDRRSLQVVQEDRVDSAGRLEASVRFEDFRSLSPSLPDGAASLVKPFKVTIQDGQGLGALQLTFHEIVPNPVLRPEDLGMARLLPESERKAS